jgi:Spy/CpxP family protein refolding chaperone
LATRETSKTLKRFNIAQERKMRYGKWLTAVLALAMIAAIPGTSTAGDRMGKDRHHRGHGPMGLKILKQLDLTEDQQIRVREMFSAHREEMRPYADQLRAARETMAQTMEAAPLDEPALREAHRALAGVREEMVVARARLNDEVRSILTPEQNARLTQLKAERRERMKDKRERRRACMDDRFLEDPDVGDDGDAE